MFGNTHEKVIVGAVLIALVGVPVCLVLSERPSPRRIATEPAPPAARAVRSGRPDSIAGEFVASPESLRVRRTGRDDTAETTDSRDDVVASPDDRAPRAYERNSVDVPFMAWRHPFRLRFESLPRNAGLNPRDVRIAPLHLTALEQLHEHYMSHLVAISQTLAVAKGGAARALADAGEGDVAPAVSEDMQEAATRRWQTMSERLGSPQRDPPAAPDTAEIAALAAKLTGTVPKSVSVVRAESWEVLPPIPEGAVLTWRGGERVVVDPYRVESVSAMADYHASVVQEYLQSLVLFFTTHGALTEDEGSAVRAAGGRR